MKRIHFILTGLTLTIIALSVNRLTPITQSFLQPFDYLRLMDFIAMIPIPLFSVLLYYLLKKEIVYDSLFRKTKFYLILMLVLITGIYFFAAGSGDHEVTNYLHFRFCNENPNTDICKIIIYNDDEFSHYIYYIGFILLNIALIGMEFNMPRKQIVSKKDLILIGINAVFIGLGIFANLAFEVIGLDLYFFGSMMLLSLYLLFFKNKDYRKLPVIFYFGVSYTLGVVGTILYKLLS
ncbi:hypothetical protein HYT02_04650 [Candidatus Gottesmanbacteria bacterium]|nr:hypothetical protein [Candidatus Gottesmanbacteria bacterium]